MRVNLLRRMAIAIVCSAVLMVGMCMTTSAQEQSQQDKKEKQGQINKHDKKNKQDAQRQEQRLDQQRQQQLIEQQQQRLTAYRQHLEQQQNLEEQYLAELQKQKRMEQNRYHQRYLEQLRQQQRRLQEDRDHDYNQDPYFYTAPNYRYHRGGTYYETNQYGVQLLQQAVRYGYEEGFRAGRADHDDHWDSDYRGSFAYRDANYGYSGYYVSRDDYNHYFREGFLRGYEDGYNRRYKYGRHSSGTDSILDNILEQILNIESLR